MGATRHTTTALIIGSGIAGCTAALTLADQGLDVILITSGEGLDNGNTALAQGGIVFHAPGESPALLERDILIAGWRYNYLKAVRHLCHEGPQAVQHILVDKLAVPFSRTTDECEWDLTMEGGHQIHRILHCADYTGRAIMDEMIRAVAKEPNIRVLTQRTAIDLLSTRHQSRDMQVKYDLANQCVGAYVFNEATGQVETVFADFTVLATGGVGQIYLHTTNTACSIGSGLTMAWRAMAWVMNAEFIQFHPTAFFNRGERRFLISEAMRGEGARLVNEKGEPFMQSYDKRGDLAPRDIVARAVVEEMLRSGAHNVYLDAGNYVKADLPTRFPTIFNQCLKSGIDIREQPIPVVPAAHYSCGGVLADVRGRTTLDRLYAVGECACTGVHGSNRLASTSLLEALLWGYSSGKDIARRLKRHKRGLPRRLMDAVPDWENLGQEANEDPALIAQDWATIRSTMWNYVGITRTTPRLHRAVEDLRSLYKRLADFYRRTPISKPIVDLFHGCYAAYVVSMAAAQNRKSIGCHYRVD